MAHLIEQGFVPRFLRRRFADAARRHQRLRPTAELQPGNPVQTLKRCLLILVMQMDDLVRHWEHEREPRRNYGVKRLSHEGLPEACQQRFPCARWGSSGSMQRLMHIVRRKLTLYVTFAPEVPSASQWARLSPNSASCSTCKRSMACWNGGYHASSRFAGMRSRLGMGQGQRFSKRCRL
ncbi:hypothetical protein Y880_0319001 [Pseudomonas aeruginosa PAK]|nr:hypothetical protein Y880_0319001 [Pseudomonas aeruginosa PAK]